MFFAALGYLFSQIRMLKDVLLKSQSLILIFKMVHPQFHTGISLPVVAFQFMLAIRKDFRKNVTLFCQ